MPSKNRVNLLGNLGRDPEVRYAPNGNAVTTISMATTETWKHRDSGERTEHTEWHRVVFFRSLAKIAADYLVKGSLIDIEGKLRTDRWTDKDGNERFSTYIVATQLLMLGGKRKDGAPEGPQSNGEDANEMDDDIPF